MKSFENFERNHEIRTPTERQFGFFLGVILLVLSGFLFYKNGNIPVNFIFMAFIVFVISFLKPVVFRPVNKIWTKLGFIMARFTNPVIIGLFFFLIFTPFSFFFRLFSKSSFVKNSKNISSTWVKYEEHSETSMENQF